MVFKITPSTSSANESLSAITVKECLLVPIEDQVCLDSIPGWEPASPEEGRHDITAPLELQTQKTPVESGLSTAGDDQHDNIDHHYREAIKRKATVDLMCEETSQGRDDVAEVMLSKRPRSLPDIRNLNAEEEEEESCIDNTVPVNGKEAAEREDHRLKLLVSISTTNLQKHSPVSRSLNSLSDIQNESASFRSRPTVQAKDVADVQKRSTTVYSTSPSTCNIENIYSKLSALSQKKKSCVRRLNLDDTILSQNSSSAGGNRHQLSTQKETAGVSISQQPNLQAISQMLLTKKQQLAPSSKTAMNERQTPVRHTKILLTPPNSAISRPLTFRHSSTVPESSTNVAGSSQQYRLGPETQLALMSNFDEEGFFVSEKSKSVSKSSHKSSQAAFGTPRNVQKDGGFEISIDINNRNLSQELFSAGTQYTQPTGHLEREKSTQQNAVEESQRVGSERHQSQNLGSMVSAMHRRQHDRQDGFTFTTEQVKSMLDVLSRLYS